jgi:hypothetical protein
VPVQPVDATPYNKLISQHFPSAINKYRCSQSEPSSALHEAGASLAQAKEHFGHSTIDMTAHSTHALESGREDVESVGRDFSSVVGLLAQ